MCGSNLPTYLSSTNATIYMYKTYSSQTIEYGLCQTAFWSNMATKYIFSHHEPEESSIQVRTFRKCLRRCLLLSDRLFHICTCLIIDFLKVHRSTPTRSTWSKSSLITYQRMHVCKVIYRKQLKLLAQHSCLLVVMKQLGMN